MTTDSLKYNQGEKGICPHCGVMVQFIQTEIPWEGVAIRGFGRLDHFEARGEWCKSAYVYSSTCPNCNLPIIACKITVLDNYGTTQVSERSIEPLIFPRCATRFVPPEVPLKIKQDFIEAVEVFEISQKASAALSRRTLQMVLEEQGYAASDLDKSIDRALPGLPGHIAENLDAIRQVGNFAAHPKKVINTGEIVEVEPEEAKFLLDVLESLFDSYYVQPKKSLERREKLNEKLLSIGKKPLKKP